jgi:hypothetical protein
MAKVSKGLVYLGGLVFCVLLLGGASATPPAEQGEAKVQEKNPYENSRILVEAFVVEVKLDALYKSGVSPIGQKPHSASIKNILTCLKNKDEAKVTAGAKVAVKNKEEGQTVHNETIILERSHYIATGKADASNTSKEFVPYKTEKYFSAKVSAEPDGKIYTSFRFRQDTLGEVSPKSDAPPNTITRDWYSYAYLEPGKPAIVGEMQDADTAVFLILTADIEDKKD